MASGRLQADSVVYLDGEVVQRVTVTSRAHTARVNVSDNGTVTVEAGYGFRVSPVSISVTATADTEGAVGLKLSGTVMSDLLGRAFPDINIGGKSSANSAGITGSVAVTVNAIDLLFPSYEGTPVPHSPIGTVSSARLAHE